jgi:hypothetical protein
MARKPGVGGPSTGTTTPTNPNVDRKPETEKEVAASNIQKMIENGRKRLGDGYRGGYNGPQPVGTPVSCSDLIDSMRAAVGLPAFCSPSGTYTVFKKLAQDAYSNRPGGGASYESGKDYPAGFLFVATSGQGGPDGTHMSMSIGGGQVLESVVTPTSPHGGGGPRIAKAPGVGFADHSQILAGPMTDVGTAWDIPGIGERLDIGGRLERATDRLGILTEGIANGVLRAVLTVAGFAYGFLVLRLLDFWGGFWWELTGKLIGELAPWLEEVDLIKVATGRETETPELPPIRSGGLVLDDTALNRLFFLLFAIFSYQLAWGRDASGNYRMDSALGGLGALSNVELRGKRAKNTRATLEAEVVEELTRAGYSPEVARRTAGRELRSMEQREVSKAARQIISRLKAERMPRDRDTGRFRVIEGGKKQEQDKSIEDEAIERLVQMGVPREQAERTVRRGNLREM